MDSDEGTTFVVPFEVTGQEYRLDLAQLQAHVEELEAWLAELVGAREAGREAAESGGHKPLPARPGPSGVRRVTWPCIGQARAILAESLRDR